MLGLSENASKWVGIGLIATGVGLGAWALISNSKEKKGNKALAGCGKKRKGTKKRKALGY